MIERRTIVFDHELLAGVEHPVFDARGAEDGPTLCLLGGVHGCEYSSIAAVIRVMDELDTTELTGRIVAVPVVEHAVVRAALAVRRSRQTARTSTARFPARLDGSYTDVLARSIFDELIAPADVLVDLHGGDLVEDLEPFALYVESDASSRAHELAVAFGLPYVLRQPPSQAGSAG